MLLLLEHSFEIYYNEKEKINQHSVKKQYKCAEMGKIYERGKERGKFLVYSGKLYCG